jgi:hypothetical protein
MSVLVLSAAKDGRFVTLAFTDERTNFDCGHEWPLLDLDRGRRYDLPADTEAFDQGLVTIVVGILQVVQQTAALVDHLEQTATRVMILLVIGEMLGEMFNARGEQRDLHFRRTGIVRRAAIVRNDLAGLFD